MIVRVFISTRKDKVDEILRLIGSMCVATPKGITIKIISNFAYIYFIEASKKDTLLLLAHIKDRVHTSMGWRRDAVYDKKDFEAAQFFQMRACVAGRSESGIMSGTRFDLSKGCPLCGTGSPQIGPLHVTTPSKLAGRAWSVTEEGDFVVRADVRDKLLVSGVAETDFRGVVNRSGKPVPDLFQLYPERELPKLDARSTGVIVDEPCVCPVCHRNGVFDDTDEPMRLVLVWPTERQNELAGSWRSWERTGLGYMQAPPGKRRQFTEAFYFFGKDAARTLLASGTRGLVFLPVTVLPPEER